MLENLEQSANDAERYSNEITGLADNMQAINGIYNNMLTAMRGPQTPAA